MEVFRAYGFDKTLFLVTLAMISFGLVMVYSSSAILASENHHHTFYFLLHQTAGAVLSILAILVMLSVRKPFYQSTIFVYSMLLISFLLLALCLFMPAIGKTNRWVQFLGMRFQPSELAKVSLILFLAYYLDRKKDRLGEFSVLLFPLAVLSVFILLIIKEPDYGTALLTFIICAILLFIGGVRLKYFLLSGTVACAFFILALFQASYRLDRIYTFLEPGQDPQGSGFQAIQSKYAVGSGGLFGVSIGESIQKLFFLPCAHTDYIYAIIGEEVGLVGTLAVLLLFFILLWRGLAISWRAPDLFSQLLAAGITLAIFTQAILNISVVLGLGPPTGFPLPLFSYGRSSLFCAILSIGILLHISQRRDGRIKER